MFLERKILGRLHGDAMFQVCFFGFFQFPFFQFPVVSFYPGCFGAVPLLLGLWFGAPGDLPGALQILVCIVCVAPETIVRSS